jgi:hypothetical protein
MSVNIIGQPPPLTPLVYTTKILPLLVIPSLATVILKYICFPLKTNFFVGSSSPDFILYLLINSEAFSSIKHWTVIEGIFVFF